MFKIHKIHLDADWSWDVHNENCAICRNNLCEPSVNAETSDVTEFSYRPVVGVCNHAFHNDCISNWLKTKKVCPLCNAPWAFKIVQNSNVANI